MASQEPELSVPGWLQLGVTIARSSFELACGFTVALLNFRCMTAETIGFHRNAVCCAGLRFK